MKAPKVKIAKVIGNIILARRGERINVILECGHWEKMTRTEIKQGYTYCWDCAYGKPKDPLAESELQIRERCSHA